MSNPVRPEYAPIVSWFLRKNPLYLMSAATMALAGRLCIADSGSAAGNLYLIALTLAVLQLYEWLVIALLFALHSLRRAPEDEPSLFVVGTLFWTGPIAATIEMTILDPELGTALSIVISLVAVAELWSANRILQLHVSKSAASFGLLTLLLVASLPSFLRMSVGAGGMHELVLYAGWWAFAMYLPLGAFGSDRQRRLPVTLILAGATAIHLIGMNHGFWCHASVFYVSPALISLAFVLLRVERQKLEQKPWLLATSLFLPVIAIGLCVQDFARPVPIHDLPSVARDMMSIAFLGTGAIWYFACWLRPAPILLHGASAAVAVGVYRLLSVESDPALHAALPWIGLYVAITYLLLIGWLRRSKTEIIAAMALHALFISNFIWERVDHHELFVKSIVGWSALTAVHILYRRPELWMRIAPILLLIQATWIERHSFFGFAHGALVVITLIIFGFFFRWTRYLWIGLGLAATAGAAFSVKGFGGMTRPRATLAIVVAFALLIFGGYVSWRKSRWLERLSADRSSEGAVDCQSRTG